MLRSSLSSSAGSGICRCVLRFTREESGLLLIENPAKCRIESRTILRSFANIIKKSMDRKWKFNNLNKMCVLL